MPFPEVFGPAVRISVFGHKLGLTVGGGHEYCRREVVLQPGVPSRHREGLHAPLPLGVGHEVHVQVAQVVEVGADAAPVGELPERPEVLQECERGGCLYAPACLGVGLLAYQTVVGHAADDGPCPDVAPASAPLVLAVCGEVRHALGLDGYVVIDRTADVRHLHARAHFPMLREGVLIAQLGGTVEGHAAGTGKVDGGRAGGSIHECAVGVSRREAQEGGIGISQAEGVAVAAKVTPYVHDDVSQPAGVPHQLQEQVGGGDVHPELVACVVAAAFVRDEGGVEVDIVHDTVEVILGGRLDVAPDTEREESVPRRQHESRRPRIVEMRQFGFFEDCQQCVARFAGGDEQDGAGGFIFYDNMLLCGAVSRQEAYHEQQGCRFH